MSLKASEISLGVPTDTDLMVWSPADGITDSFAISLGTLIAELGNVVGPSSSTDNAIARFDQTTGKVLSGSGITIADGASGTLDGSNSGDVTLAGIAYLTLTNQLITAALIDLTSHVTGRLPYANLTASTVAGRLLGRRSASAGDWEEITVGTGLTLSSTTISLAAHASSHQSGGSDAIKLDDLASPDDNTDLNVSITKHGLTPKLPNDATKFLDGTGAYTVPPSGSSLPVADTQTVVKGSSDATKLLRFEVDGFTTGTTRVVTPLNKDYTLEETVHASKHVSGGSDSIKLDDLAAPDDNTDLNCSTTAHGLLKKLPNDSSLFMDGTGNWAAVVGGGGGGAPANAQYIVEANSSDLSAEILIGTVISTGVDASKPSPTTAGRLYLPTNGVQIYRDNASALKPYGPIFPLTPPVNGDFAWINQGGASVDTTYGGIYLEAPAGAGENMRIRKKAYPFAKFTLTVGFIPNILVINSSSIGIGFRQSSDGKTLDWMMQSSGNVLPLLVQKHSSPTAAAGSLLNNAVFPVGPMIFLQIEDDGTNRNYRWSMDGQHFVLAYSEGRTTYMTGDEIHFFANSLQTSYAIGINVIHWKEVQIP